MRVQADWQIHQTEVEKPRLPGSKVVVLLGENHLLAHARRGVVLTNGTMHREAPRPLTLGGVASQLQFDESEFFCLKAVDSYICQRRHHGSQIRAPQALSFYLRHIYFFITS